MTKQRKVEEEQGSKMKENGLNIGALNRFSPTFGMFNAMASVSPRTMMASGEPAAAAAEAPVRVQSNPIAVAAPVTATLATEIASKDAADHVMMKFSPTLGLFSSMASIGSVKSTSVTSASSSRRSSNTVNNTAFSIAGRMNYPHPNPEDEFIRTLDMQPSRCKSITSELEPVPESNEAGILDPIRSWKQPTVSTPMDEDVLLTPDLCLQYSLHLDVFSSMAGLGPAKS
jgi:hypothetical protein